MCVCGKKVMVGVKCGPLGTYKDSQFIMCPSENHKATTDRQTDRPSHSQTTGGARESPDPNLVCCLHRPP